MQSVSTPLVMPRCRTKIGSWENALGKKPKTPCKRNICEVVESEDDDGVGSIGSAESAPQVHSARRVAPVRKPMPPIKRIASDATMSSAATRAVPSVGPRTVPAPRARAGTPNSVLDDSDARSCASASNSATESNTSEAQRKAHHQKKNWMKTRKVGLGEASVGAPPAVFFGSNQHA